MNIVSINYIVQNGMDDQKLAKIISGLSSSKYKVLLNLYDFSLSKNMKDMVSNLKIDEEKIKIIVIDSDYEELENANKIIVKNFMQYVDSISIAILHDNLILHKDALDRIEFARMKEENIGFTYPDYNIKDVRCYLRSHASNVQISTPAVFWSTDKILRHIAEQDILSTVYNSYIGVHIPESLCTAYPNEK